MSIHIHILNASGQLDSFADQLSTIAKKTFSLVKKYIPLQEIDVLFCVNPQETIPEIGGLGGYTPSAHLVTFSLDPKHPRFRQALTEELPQHLTHEFHHAARWASVGYGTTLFESLITEGLADHFSIEVTGRQPPPWCHALSPRQKTNLFRRARRMWNTSPYPHTRWFFGSQKAHIPRWAGYTLGFDLVKNYLDAHHEGKPSSLVSAPSSLFRL